MRIWQRVRGHSARGRSSARPFATALSLLAGTTLLLYYIACLFVCMYERKYLCMLWGIINSEGFLF